MLLLLHLLLLLLLHLLLLLLLHLLLLLLLHLLLLLLLLLLLQPSIVRIMWRLHQRSVATAAKSRRGRLHHHLLLRLSHRRPRLVIVRRCWR